MKIKGTISIYHMMNKNYGGILENDIGKVFIYIRQITLTIF